MNWLAHLYLSEPETEFRLGNLLADQVRGADRNRMSASFLRGVACHQAIDAFTEHHPVIKHSRTLIGPAQRRFSGILVDVFYDYFLAKNWNQFSGTPLERFTHGAYGDFQPHIPTLPEEARITLERIITHDWLTSYREIAGIEDVLTRLTARISETWQRRIPALNDAVADLQKHEAELEADFQAFMPQLASQVRRWSIQNDRKKVDSANQF